MGKTEAASGGQQCPELSESRDCNTQGCAAARNCQVSEWGAFTPCSVKCGGGTQKHTRKVITQAENGGQECPSLSESRDCNQQGCVDSSDDETAAAAKQSAS